jgi:hypothetical protein
MTYRTRAAYNALSFSSRAIYVMPGLPCKKPWLVKPGEIPPSLRFIYQFSHVADSCINADSARSMCNGYSSLADDPCITGRLEQMFGYHPGRPEGMPILAKVNQYEELEHYYENSYSEMIRLFSHKASSDYEE